MTENDLSAIDNLIVDMDGVLWRGLTPLPGLQEFFWTMSDLDIDFVLATNNATKTASDYCDRLAVYGVDVPTEKILGSAVATARFLKTRYASGSVVYVIGERGLRDALQDQGFSVRWSDGFVGKEATAEAVVIGLSRDACYPQIASAVHLVNQGAALFGTNPDVTFPTEDGLMPGAGALLASVVSATGIEPTIIGKPNLPMFEEAIKRMGARPEATAVVGDRLATDIVGGKNAGLRTILMLTGVTKKADLSESVDRPDWIMGDLVELSAALVLAKRGE